MSDTLCTCRQTWIGLQPPPLLCAGITTYSPLKHYNVGKGKKVGIIGLGGLGHMGLKFSHAFGAHTVMFTTSPSKVEDAKNSVPMRLFLQRRRAGKRHTWARST